MARDDRRPFPPSHDTVHPEVDGPGDIDRATSDFANRAARILRYGSLTGAGGRDVFDEIAGAARASFAGVEPRNLRGLITFPLRLPLSFGSLLAQELVRGRTRSTSSAPPGRRVPRWSSVEAFLDYPVFQALQYRDEIERYRERLRQAPNDATARLQLGRSYIKCGLYAQALDELALAADDPGTRAQAMYERLVAGTPRRHGIRQAIADGVSAIAAGASEPRAQHWMWLASRKLGGYPAETPVERRVEMKAGLSPTALRYRDVAQEIGLDKTSGGRGTAVFDIDGDGELDVIISAVSGGCGVYRNNGDGTFRDASVGSGLDACVNAWGISAGDYDNDGRTDLFVTRLGFFDGQAALYHNNGDGTFTDVTREAGVSSWAPGFTAGWVDFDLDGHLDLFVPSNLGGVFHRSKRHRLFHNNGDGTFTDVTLDAGLTTWGPAVGATLGRLRQRRISGPVSQQRVRALAALPQQRQRHVHRRQRRSRHRSALLRHGRLLLRLRQRRLARPRAVLVVQQRGHDPEPAARTGLAPAGSRCASTTTTATARSRSRTASWGSWSAGASMSGNAADLDNDGRLDLLLGNGGPQMDRSDPLVVLANDGRRFRERHVRRRPARVGKGARRERGRPARRRPHEPHRRVRRHVSGRAADDVGVPAGGADGQLPERAAEGRHEQPRRDRRPAETDRPAGANSTWSSTAGASSDACRSSSTSGSGPGAAPGRSRCGGREGRAKRSRACRSTRPL